jgi:hypothetical protein
VAAAHESGNRSLKGASNIMKNKFFRISKLSLDLTPKTFNAMLLYKGSKPIFNHMINLVRILVSDLSSNWVRLTVYTIKRMYRILQTQGLCGYVKYLKVCCVSIQQSIGGHVERDLTPLGPRVSRTSKGLPRILPWIVRREISRGNPLYVKWALTIFSVFRVIVYDAPLKINSIIDPRKGSLQGENYIALYLDDFVKFHSKIQTRRKQFKSSGH